MNDTFLQLMRLKAQGYCCAQIILLLALEARGETNAPLVRSLGGLCFGLHWSGEVCGAIAGGACLLSLYAGKGSAEETADERHLPMLDELVDWFRQRGAEEYGGTRCAEILARFPERGKCGQIVVETYAKCLDILAGHGFDPAGGQEG